jgi:hypothetical protein
MLRQFTARRLRHVRYNSFGAFKEKPSSKEDEDTFISIFNKIMDKSNKAARNDTEQSGLLFDETFKSIERLKDNVLPRSFISPRLVGVSNKKKEYKMTQSYELVKSEKLHNALEETLRTIDEMETDMDCFQFMEPLILKLDAQIDKDAIEFNDALCQKIIEQSVKTPLTPLCNEHTASLLLIKVIKTLNERFQSPDTALTLFEIAKQQSLKTYVYLCTPGVYTQVLKLYWDSYKSISRVNNLIREMKVNGIQGNHDTIQLLKLVSKEAHQMMHEDDLLSFNLDNGPEMWAPVWNKSDEEELRSVDNYIADLYVFLEKQYL